MAWWMAIPAAVGAVTSLVGGEEQRKQNQRQMMVEAGRVRASPYLNLPGVDVRQKPRSHSFLQGALAGAQFAKLNKDLWDDGDASPPDVSPEASEAMAMNVVNPFMQQGQMNPMGMGLPMQPNPYDMYA